jgi:hypothetical protein
MEIKIVLDTKKLILVGVFISILVLSCILGAFALMTVISQDKTTASEAADYSDPYAPDPLTSNYYYFAEGYTGEGFQEWLLLFLPPHYSGGSSTSCRVIVEYFGNSGSKIATQFVDLNPGQRYTINVNEVLLAEGYVGDVSIVTHAFDYQWTGYPKPFVCERAMYFDNGVYNGGNTSSGYFEEGVIPTP